MKISVDTAEDSPEDIRKVVALLSSLSDKNYSRIGRRKNIFESSSPEVGQGSSQQVELSAEDTSNAFAGMFGGSGSSSSSAPSQSASDRSMNIFSSDEDKDDDSSGEEEKEEETVEIIPY